MIYFLCTCFFDFFNKSEWITIISTIFGLLASVGIAYWIFNSEQESREKEEAKLNNDQYKYFEYILDRYLDSINMQSNNLKEYLEDTSYHLALKRVIGIPTTILNKLDFLRLEKVVVNSKLNSKDFHKLLLKLNYTDEIFANITDEFFRYFDKLTELENLYKKNQYDLLRYHSFELLNLLKHPDFSKDFKDEVFAYNKLISDVSKDESIFPIDGKSAVNKEQLFSKVFEPAMKIIMPLRARNTVFLEIASKLNTVANILNDINNLKRSHHKIMNSYKEIIDSTQIAINEFKK